MDEDKMAENLCRLNILLSEQHIKWPICFLKGNTLTCLQHIGWDKERPSVMIVELDALNVTVLSYKERVIMGINVLALHWLQAFTTYEEQMISQVITVTAQTQRCQSLLNKCAWDL